MFMTYERIRNLREDMDKTQTEVAEYLNCSQVAYSYYEIGRRDIPTTTLETEYNLRFYQYVENFYVINEQLKDFYASKMYNKGINLKAVGAPSLENLKEYSDENYVIYAPHWTIDHEKTIAYSSFKENGMFMLEYAKKHPEFNWVFKPHPLLKKALVDNNFMTKQEVEEYYSSWEKLGKACYSGNYFEIFNNSKLMITDCSTFLIEFLLTGKPLINIISEEASEFNIIAKEVIKHLYKAENIQELEKHLNNILVYNQDELKQERVKASRLFRQDTTKNILNDLLKQKEGN